MKTITNTIYLASALSAFAWFALLPPLKAQCPSDCNGTSTALGNNALNPASTGVNNTAVGASALTAVTTGSFNVAVGGGALGSKPTGQQNMARGAGRHAHKLPRHLTLGLGFP